MKSQGLLWWMECLLIILSFSVKVARLTLWSTASFCFSQPALCLEWERKLIRKSHQNKCVCPSPFSFFVQPGTLLNSSSQWLTENWNSSQSSPPLYANKHIYLNNNEIPNSDRSSSFFSLSLSLSLWSSLSITFKFHLTCFPVTGPLWLSAGRTDAAGWASSQSVTPPPHQALFWSRA